MFTSREAFIYDSISMNKLSIHFDLICDVDVAGDNGVHGLLEVDVLVVVVVVVAVDPVVDVRHSVKDGECHSSKHQRNKLRIKRMDME